MWDVEKRRRGEEEGRPRGRIGAATRGRAEQATASQEKRDSADSGPEAERLQGTAPSARLAIPGGVVVKVMAHNVKMSGNGVKFCTKCGEQVFSAVCAGEVAQMQLSAAQNKLNFEATMVQNKLNIEVHRRRFNVELALRHYRERMRMATYLLIALITLSVTVYFLHDAVPRRRTSWSPQ